MSSSDLAWPFGVDFALLDCRFGSDKVNRCLDEDRDYAEPPRLDSSGRLRARPTYGGAALQVAVRLRDEKAFEFTCSCPDRYVCEHVLGVLVDLAVHPELRAALAHGAPAELAVSALPALRRGAFEERTLDERLARWLPPRVEEDLAIDVEIVRPAAVVGSAHADGRPLVLLRLRQPE